MCLHRRKLVMCPSVACRRNICRRLQAQAQGRAFGYFCHMRDVQAVKAPPPQRRHPPKPEA